MRIAIDGRTITSSRSGVGVYAERVVRSLLEIDHDSEYILFLVEPQPGLEAPNLRKILIEGYDRMILNRWWENVLLPQYVRSLGIDLYFSPAYALPLVLRFRRFAALLPLPGSIRRMISLRTGPRFVVAIHDVITSVLPETFTPKMRMWQYIFNSNAVRVADRILASSESTRRDILKYFGGDPSKISVVHLSLEERFRHIDDPDTISDVRNRYSLPERFILTVGTIEPRKNHIALVRAYASLPEHVRSQYPLVIVGARGWYSDDILQKISSAGVDDSLRFIGYARHEDIPAMYSMASLFVFPSLYEGFGYPPLEAMSCGTPVVCSNRSSLPEVVGDAGLLFDPDDTGELSRTMARVLNDPGLQQVLRQKGFERARVLSWGENARKTLEVFREVAAEVA